MPDEGFSFERRVFHAPDGDIAYLFWGRAGRDKPLLHFFHANGYNAHTYRRLLEPLSAKLRVAAWDARGHGRSTLNADPKRLKDWKLYSEDLARFLDHLGEPVFLAGHSMGGVVSLDIYGRFPELTRGLILIDPVILPVRWAQTWAAAKAVGLGSFSPISARAAKRQAVWTGREALFNAYRGRGGFKTWRDEWLRDYIVDGTRAREGGSIELTCTPAWEARSFATLPSWVWKAVRRARPQMSVVYGKKSNTFRPAAAKEIKHLCPFAHLAGVEGATHFVPMEFPETVAEEILKLVGNNP